MSQTAHEQTHESSPVESDQRLTRTQWGVVLSVSIAAAAAFWPRLLAGESLIGGDIYPYFLPQKVFYKQALEAGTLPLWNHLVGHGYPQLAESQTGVLYPPNVWLYWQFDVVSAYQFSHLLHYVWAFVGTVLFASRLRINLGASLLVALIFVYGWFPPRSCLEWAIVTGAWMPWQLWATESFHQSRKLSSVCWLGLFTAMQLLAGHYHLAFLSVLLCCGYSLLRTLTDQSIHTVSVRTRILLPVGIVLSLGVGFLLAACQLLPSWELKQLSQRETESSDFVPQYGHLPHWYLTNSIMPWRYFDDGLDDRLNSTKRFSVSADTNQVEAHFYVGLLPLVLAIIGLFTKTPDECVLSRTLRWGLLLLALLSIVYATGWLVPLADSIPGFGYFRAPGRYGIMATVCIGLLAAMGLQRLTNLLDRRLGMLTIIAVLLITFVDLRLVGRQVGYTRTIPISPIEVFADRDLFDLEQPPSPLLDEVTQGHVHAPMPNVATLFGIRSSPVYLGIGPVAYFDNGPLSFSGDRFVDETATPKVFAEDYYHWLQARGFTGVLAFEPVQAPASILEKLEPGEPQPITRLERDLFLNAVWARSEPFFVHRVTRPRARFFFTSEQATTQSHASASIDFGTVLSSKIEINQATASVSVERDSLLVMNDLMLPGWRVEVDGQPAEAISFENAFRSVALSAGRHEVRWTYEPASFWWGCGISVTTLFLLLISVGLAWRARCL